MTDVQLAQLRIELDTDPKGLGYAGKTDPPVAALLNNIGLSGEVIAREVIDGQELSKAVVIGEYVALSDAARAGWAVILSAGTGQVDVADSRVKAQVAAIWGPATTTRANLLALATRDCSRAEALFGVGIAVSYLDVGKARL